jgi:hypothetical protein
LDLASDHQESFAFCYSHQKKYGVGLLAVVVSLLGLVIAGLWLEIVSLAGLVMAGVLGVLLELETPVVLDPKATSVGLLDHIHAPS